MSGLKPLSWKVLKCIFGHDGFTEERTKGSHMSMTKPNVARPVVLPRYDEVPVFIIRGLMRTAGMSRKRFLELLALC